VRFFFLLLSFSNLFTSEKKKKTNPVKSNDIRSNLMGTKKETEHLFKISVSAYATPSAKMDPGIASA